MEQISLTAHLIKESKYTVAFTGAGISVESGILPFRGKNGLWNKYDPACLDLDTYFKDTVSSWKIIKEIFYDFLVFFSFFISVTGVNETQSSSEALS